MIEGVLFRLLCELSLKAVMFFKTETFKLLHFCCHTNTEESCPLLRGAYALII